MGRRGTSGIHHPLLSIEMPQTNIQRAFATVGERQVHYRHAGEGPPVVLLHQSPASSAALAPLIRRLAARFSVIAPDTPGYGHSDPLVPADAEPGIDDYVDAMAALFDVLGLQRPALFGSHTGAIIATRFASLYQVNVVGAYQMVRACAPAMKAQGQAAVVMVSSIGGVTAIASSIAYAASKAALNLMTKSLALTLGPEIRVNAICPGMIQTRWLKAGLDDERYDATVKVGMQLSPLHKVSTPDEVAETILWMLEGAPIVTGQIVLNDAGMHLGQLPPMSRRKVQP